MWNESITINELNKLDPNIFKEILKFEINIKNYFSSFFSTEISTGNILKENLTHIISSLKKYEKVLLGKDNQLDYKTHNKELDFFKKILNKNNYTQIGNFNFYKFIDPEHPNVDSAFNNNDFNIKNFLNKFTFGQILYFIYNYNFEKFYHFLFTDKTILNINMKTFKVLLKNISNLRNRLFHCKTIDDERLYKREHKLSFLLSFIEKFNNMCMIKAR